MIQRIQTIFLFLAAAAAFGAFALPFASTDSEVSTSSLFADGIYNLQDHVGLLALFGGAGVLTLISIFLFKNRKTQLLLGRLGIVAYVIGFILAIILYMQDSGNLGTTDPTDELGVYLPVLFLLFAILAQRGIMKDDKLVNSMDRLR